MPSRADAGRVVERAARVAAWAALAGLAWLSFVPPASVRTVAVPGSALAGALERWTVRPEADSMFVRLEMVPPPAWRDWLTALRGAGTAVAWSGSVAPVAAEVLTTPDPAVRVAVHVAAPGMAVTLRDRLGTLDSVRAGRFGTTLALAGTAAGVRVLAGGQWLEPAPADSLAARRIAVLAHAGWESKFAVAALEERGWDVDARLGVAPGIVVTQGRPWPLDTGRHAAVLVLDSLSAGDAAGVAAFVRSGGGVILCAEAARRGVLGALAPVSVGPRERPAVIGIPANAPRSGLGLAALVARTGAIVLEDRDGRPAVVARRAGAGRVVVIGYDDTWRWRLSGDEAAPAAHRAWWADVVAAAAHRPAVGRPRGSADPAPAASQAFGLGEPVPEPGNLAEAGPVGRAGLAALLFLIAVTGLLVEWALRRVRGAR